MAAHSTLSASKAERWTTCPGSLILAKGVAETGSPAAREGTGLHALLDHCLANKLDATDFEGQTWAFDDHGEACDMEISDEQAEAVQSVIDFVRTLPGVLFTEMQVAYGRAIGQPDSEAFGTTDVAVLDGTHLHVVDAKFGRHYVDQFENKQMLLYGIGVVDSLEVLGDAVDSITLYIAQPRAGFHNPEGWTLTRAELEEWITYFKEAARRVETATALFNPAWLQPGGWESLTAKEWVKAFLQVSEDACRFCPVRAACPALQALADETAKSAPAAASADEFDTTGEDAMTLLDDAVLAHHLANAGKLEMFLEAVKTEAMRRLVDGRSVPGFKLITGRQGNRKWVDEKAAEAAVRKHGGTDAAVFAPAKIKTPAQMAKILKPLLGTKEAAEELLDTLTTRSPAKPALVARNVPGAPWAGGNVESEFGTVQSDEFQI